jgi:hypothetical protein
MTSRRDSTRVKARGAKPRLRDAVVSLDAEDIALARLQAHLRKAEAIQPAIRPVTSLQRTVVRLTAALLARLRERAKRDGTTPSEVVEKALLRFLHSR